MMKAAPSATRRRFLEASAGAAAAAWLAPLKAALSRAFSTAEGERLLGTVPFVGEGNFPVEAEVGAGLGRRRALDLATLTGETLLTPRDRFFIRTGAPERLPPTDTWKVRVHGLVEAPRELPIADLKREAVPLGVELVECAGNSRAAHFGLMSAARWTGVPLERVLDRVVRLPKATRVLVSGFDEHEVQDPGSVPGASWIFGLDQVRASGAFLATGMNGGSLTPDHGHPLRLVVPGWYGCTAIKWVNEIALVDDEAPATDQMREYAGRTHQGGAEPPRRARDFQPATIDPAAVAVRVEKIDAGGGRLRHRIVGIRWGAPAGLPLSIRLRPDQALVPVERSWPGLENVWAVWSHTVEALAPGRYRIELAINAPGVRARRLDAGYYAREVDIFG
jgi:DMSO/TMAO reductase YedYZ molybdopterin-dependent catalytic subunit